MGRCCGRAWAYAAGFFLSFVALRPALAQDSDEVIVDPELSGGSNAAGASAPGADGDEVIADPELSGAGRPGSNTPAEDYGWGAVLPTKSSDTSAEAAAATLEEDEYDPLANTGIGRLELLGQTAVDMHSEGDLEDFYEARLRFGGEVDFRISRKLRLSLGTRLDFLWAAPHQSDPYLTRDIITYDDGEAIRGPGRYNESALDQDRYEVDIVPLSAYVDMTLGEGVHMRLGTQVISLGRMDGYSATDILAVHDLRPSPKVDPAGIKLAQPAVRLDWDINSWATLQAAYVPWFMPSVVRPNRDQYTGTALLGYGSRDAFGGGDNVVDPSYQTKAGETNLRYLGPPPDFSHPQAEARLNFRGSTFELALLGGTALEKLPSVYYVPAIDQFLRDTMNQGTLQTDIGQYALQRYPLFDVAYHRYYLLGFDGSFDIAPLQVGFEFGYSPERHLYASNKEGKALPLPNVTEQICNPGEQAERPADAPPYTGCAAVQAGNSSGNLLNRSIRKGVPVVQGTLHVEYLKDESLALVAEAYLIQALELPYDRTRDWTGFIPGTGLLMGGLIGGNKSFEEGKYRVDLSAVITTGPSFIVSPQFEVRVVEGFYLNLGAQIFEGPQLDIGPKSERRVANNLSVGGLYSGYDNVYLGFRWIPQR